jgi:hypothetical protein
MTGPEESIDVTELASMAGPEDLECFAIHDYRTNGDAWCLTCNLPSAVVVERVCWLVNTVGVTALVLHQSLYCVDHDGFMAVPS